MVQEVERLHAPKIAGTDGAAASAGLSWERMDELGLEYKYIAQYLQNKMPRTELVETLANKIWQYARRQKTWFKRDNRITWLPPAEILKVKGKKPIDKKQYLQYIIEQTTPLSKASKAFLGRMGL